jgi:polyhydroxybutyrate depolymerase
MTLRAILCSAVLSVFTCPALLATNPAATSVEKSITIGGLSRKYLLFAPPSAGQQMPLVIALHGGGSNARQMERYTRFNDLAQREEFVVMYPESVGGNWNDGRQTESIRAQRENIDDVNFIRAAVEATIKNYPIDRRRIFATGISNGAMMLHRLAAEASDLLAGVATVAGELTPPIAANFRPQYPVSIFIIHGDRDPIVPIEGGEVRAPDGRGRGKVLGARQTLDLYIKRNGNADRPTITMLDTDVKDRTSIEISKYPDAPGGEKAWLYLVKNGGHTWPGRPLYLSEAVIGSASQDFDATEVIWQFFKSCPPRILGSAHM